jgi:hypothetical protein
LLDLQNKVERHEEFLDHLKSIPEEDAIRLLRGLKSTDDPGSGLPLTTHGLSKSRRLSEHKTARAVLPPVRTSLEFELTVLHKIMYPALTPLENAFGNASSPSKSATGGLFFYPSDAQL